MLTAALTATVAAWVVAVAPGSAGAAAQPVPVPLGAAAGFAVLAGTSVTNTGTSTITGDVGVAPGSTVTGFTPPSIVNGIIHINDTAATQAQTALATAFADVTSRPSTGTIAPALGGQTLPPGVYTSTGGPFTLSGDLTLDAKGDPNAVFVIRGSSLTVAAQGTVTLAGGARACNVFLALTRTATLYAGSRLRGNVLVVPGTAGGIVVGADVTVEGRLLAGPLAAVTLAGDTVTAPRGCATGRNTTVTVTFSCSGTGPGRPLSLNAIVRSANGPVTSGQVRFTSDGATLGTAPLDSSGRATLANPNLTEGIHRIVATFEGTPEFDPATSQPLELPVGPDGKCPEECEHEHGRHDHGVKGEAEDADKQNPRTVRKDRHDRRHHHQKDHGKLVTLQTLHTLAGVFGEDGHHGHHSHHDSGSHHGQGPKGHQNYQKPYQKPRYHKYYKAPRPRVAVTG
ncbi:hypothetical protein Skr01_16510 [Sphaerisporangium krabiense]|uniref:Bacterial Ig-like domain-containing protein n=1 Tax=Sphaerisporangium krabiense TaxID=763782 RepID=A0A7W8YZP0_9ACTN|nr:ice-binding family protein [Sphaerisporangium krabiense]MBB5624478.1 hypothetical protein [Sphaerisporangium krabiense]GII61566.1 hypothetical protein Skr01_16510 [Sphaerisporangium krabiense]